MSFQQSLVTVALTEWDRFGRDSGQADKTVGGVAKEAVSPFAERVGDYWLAIPSASYNSLVKTFAKNLGKLDGTVRALPWSAAFISFCMNTAGAGAQFPYSAGHATWINKAILNRRNNKTAAPLFGERPGEGVLSLGDVLGKARLGLGVTFDNAPEFVKPGADPEKDKGWYESHSDIVVEIDLPARKAFLIGGNVGQSVSKVEVRIDAGGKLVPGSGDYFVHIRNQINTPELAFAPPLDITPKVG